VPERPGRSWAIATSTSAPLDVIRTRREATTHDDDDDDDDDNSRS
jgi:hypothetical protein